MQYYNNNLAVEANWLMSMGIISESNYRQLSARKTITVLRRGCLNTPALVDYESLPERFKREVRKIVPEPYKAVRVNQIEERIEDSAVVREFFDNYRLDDGRYLPAEKRREYYANALVLEAIHQLIISKRAKRSALGHRVTRAWEQLSEGVQEIDRSKYPHQLPANPRRLEDKYRLYKKEGLKSLIHKNFTNANAAKIEDSENEAMLAMLISDPRNLDNEQVRSLYNMMAEKMGWKKISAPTVARWRDKLDSMLYARRRGSVAFSNLKAMQVKRSAPTYPLYFWTMDGWDAELMYQITENGGTTYHNRPTVVIVLDACCKYPIGYAVGTHETPELIQAALRNAALHTESLFGQMYRSNQLQSDRYAVKKMTPIYEAMADKFTPARAKNAKAKIIEPYFNSINKKYCQMAINWSGYGITSNKDKQPNSEFLNKYKKDFPDFEGVCRQLTEIIERERAEKREEYLSKWNECPEEHKILLPYENYLMLFGSTTGHKNLLQGSGLKITIGGQKRDYDCFDHDFRKYASTRWEVRYDPQDLRRVLAVNEDESLRFILEEKYVQPMALRERKEGDYEQLQRVKDYNKQLEEKVSVYISAAQEQTKELMAGIPQLDTLNKLMITDSKGQHKNRRNDNRLPVTAKEQIREAIFEHVDEDIYNDY
jgi:hypothetical protein